MLKNERFHHSKNFIFVLKTKKFSDNFRGKKASKKQLSTFQTAQILISSAGVHSMTSWGNIKEKYKIFFLHDMHLLHSSSSGEFTFTGNRCSEPCEWKHNQNGDAFTYSFLHSFSCSYFLSLFFFSRRSCKQVPKSAIGVHSKLIFLKTNICNGNICRMIKMSDVGASNGNKKKTNSCSKPLCR